MADRMTEKDWRRVERHAAPQAIEARLKTARRHLADAQRTVTRWEALLALRLSQVEAGTWPPAVTRVTWRDLRCGDVIADPDGDRPVLKWKASDPGGEEWVTIWYDAGPWGTCTDSAPADREVAIRPRAEDSDAEG